MNSDNIIIVGSILGTLLIFWKFRVWKHINDYVEARMEIDRVIGLRHLEMIKGRWEARQAYMEQQNARAVDEIFAETHDE